MKQRLNDLINATCEQIYYSTSFFKFLESNRNSNVIARLLYNYANGDSWPYNQLSAYRFMFTTSEINYLTFRNDGTISYLPNGKEHKVNDDKTWNKDGRQNGKPAKVIRKLFTPLAQTLLKDSDFETFTNTYKATFSNDGYKFEIIPANEIPAIYRMKSSSRMTGDAGLNNSCMNNEDANFFDLYKYCKHLRMVVLYNKEKLLAGRALLWNVKDDNGNDVVLMDRFYCAQDFLFQMFIDYAKKNKFWYKVKYNSTQEQTLFVNTDENRVCQSFKVYTDTSLDAYPYLDTFQYGGDGWISNDCDNSCYEYDQTDGTRTGDDDDDNTIWDEIYERDIDRDDAVQIERGQKRGYWTHRNNTVEVNNYTWWENDDDIVYVSGHGHCHRDDVVYCERDGEDYHRDNCVETHNNEWILDNESVTTKDGNVYHEDDDDIIEIDGTWYEKDSDDVCEIDGDYYLVDSDEIVSIDGDYYHVDNDDIIEIGGTWYLKDSDEDMDGEYILRQLSLAFDKPHSEIGNILNTTFALSAKQYDIGIWIELRQDEDRFYMICETLGQSHSIAKSVTNEERLSAHWNGFIDNCKTMLNKKKAS